MGEVFLARDLALGRPAALKVVPAGVTSERRQRLLREAAAASRLQHPGIATFYEAAEADGIAYIAMELVRGRTLRARLREGPMAWDHATAVAASLLEALAHAHAAGVLHRDIKPENIMLTGERSAKLLDFGLAKWLLEDRTDDAPTQTQLTGEGLVVGSVGYIAPEQLRGEPVDQRCDLFAVGAVLYEAISGRAAFPGATATARLAAVLSRDPAPLEAPGMPPALGALVARALARPPVRRPVSAREFLFDMLKVSEGQAVAELPEALLVLDFENLSRDSGDDWMAAGIAESVAADLSRVPELMIVPRERLLRLGAKSERPDPSDLGLRVGCRWVLGGGFQRVGPSLRITTRLAEAATGRVIADKFDGTVEAIFDVQDRVAAAVVTSLNLQKQKPSAGVRAPTLSAYECYARGRNLSQTLLKGTLDHAQQLFEQAVALEPAYAAPFAGLARVHALRFNFTTDRRDLEAAEGHARRAIAADARLGEPHLWLGYVLLRQGRAPEAWEECERALALEPSNALAAYVGAMSLLADGRREDALAGFQRTVRSDPGLGLAWLFLGLAHSDLGRHREARWCLEKAVEIERASGRTSTAGASGILGECLRRAGLFEEARVRCLEGLEAVEASDHVTRDAFRAACLNALGRAALDQGDRAAPRAAFAQALAHLRGRPRTMGGGHMMVQALCGWVRAGAGTEADFEEAQRLFEGRCGFDFSLVPFGSDDVTMLELARAAAAVGRKELARDLRERARAAGSLEAAGPE